MDYWLHADADDVPWLLVSTDFVVAGAVRDTLRLDFDAAGVRGGWSPAFLNWDDGVRAQTAGIDVAGPDESAYPRLTAHLAILPARPRNGSSSTSADGRSVSALRGGLLGHDGLLSCSPRAGSRAREFHRRSSFEISNIRSRHILRRFAHCGLRQSWDHTAYSRCRKRSRSRRR